MAVFIFFLHWMVQKEAWSSCDAVYIKYDERIQRSADEKQ